MRFYDQPDLGITAKVSSRSKIVILELHRPMQQPPGRSAVLRSPGARHRDTEHSVTEKALLDNADGAIR